MMTTLWTAKWRSKNKIDGKQEHLVWHNLMPAIFKTRRECREFINREFGFIRSRPDLRREPHGWEIPRAVKVEIREIR